MSVALVRLLTRLEDDILEVFDFEVGALNDDDSLVVFNVSMSGLEFRRRFPPDVACFEDTGGLVSVFLGRPLPRLTEFFSGEASSISDFR
eukprot:CAMPEP_0171382190 /NCGR_PEP_ID=MMETSP0879-20121228/33638_1 /TAXON_ID=67004 /ORGANISM="Thalassiosira weissflogii, Strain CCMP1336" /LENGTH=89 /DNA_ID=CAMNT_0011893883 /DNA_START=115 /DNA_END=380 /DNA_ORIENTATION=-